MDRDEGEPYHRGASEPLEPGSDWGFPQSDIVAELARQAAEGMDYGRLMRKVCQATSDLLGVEYVDVFQLRPRSGNLILREGVGWPEEAKDAETMTASPQSQTGYTVRSWKPTIVHDIREDGRFRPSTLMEESGIRSGVTVVIPAPVDPWGLFGAHSTEPRRFGERETTFVQAMAQVLSLPIRGQRSDERIRRERERYEALLQEVEDYAIFTCDPTGHVQTWNKGAEKIQGYTEQEILGEQLSIFYTPEDREAGVPEDDLSKAAERGSIRDEGWRLRKDGSRFWANITLTALHDDEGRLRGFAKITKDMTERRAREQRVERSRQTIVDNFPNGAVALVDEDLRLQMVGGTPAADIDRPLEQVEGMKIREAIPDPLGEEAARLLEQALEGESSSFEHETEEGSFYRIRVVPVRGESGEVFAALAMSQDVTEEKQRERELAASNERLEQFAYAASHDMQEPLRMVYTYLDLIDARSGEALDEESHEYLAHAKDGAQRMRRMITSLLRYSQIETEGQPFEPVDVNAVAETVMTDLDLQIQECDAEVTVGDLPQVRADPDQLAQVLRNLLSNALKYSGDEPPRVHVDAVRANGMWRFSVRDEGVGIEPEHTEEIFDAFKRATEPREDAGVGLGLAICERIVDRHGGRIWVDSEPDEGSTFYFTMPAVDDEEGRG